MNYIEKLNNTEFILKIKVKPNSKKQMIVKTGDEDNYMYIMLQSKAIKNKANKELIELFQKRLRLSSKQVTLLSGDKTQIKRIKLSFPREISSTDLVNALNLN